MSSQRSQHDLEKQARGVCGLPLPLGIRFRLWPILASLLAAFLAGLLLGLLLRPAPTAGDFSRRGELQLKDTHERVQRQGARSLHLAKVFDSANIMGKARSTAKAERRIRERNMARVIRRSVNPENQLVWHFDDESVRMVTTAVLYDPQGNPILLPNAFVPLDRVPANPAVPIWTPAAGKRFRLMRVWLTASAKGNILLTDGPGGPVIAVVSVVAGGAAWPLDLGHGYQSKAVGNALYALSASPGATISGLVGGLEEKP